MTEYLVFRLYGPMAAWGDIAVGEYRPSFAHPSKSAIIGLIAAALGIRRDEEERQRSLAESCSFAVRVDAMGTLLRDYHTVQVPGTKKGVTHYTRYSELRSGELNTILSTRDYRCDAAYTVGLLFKDNSDYNAQETSDKLRNPEFCLYLGRKSCPPALPLQAQVIQADDFKGAFDAASFKDDEVLTQLPATEAGVYWEDGTESGYETEHVITRRDEPLSRIRWQFNNRYEHYANIQKEG